jgi:hypothetical protein
MTPILNTVIPAHAEIQKACRCNIPNTICRFVTWTKSGFVKIFLALLLSMYETSIASGEPITASPFFMYVDNEEANMAKEEGAFTLWNRPMGNWKRILEETTVTQEMLHESVSVQEHLAPQELEERLKPFQTEVTEETLSQLVV